MSQTNKLWARIGMSFSVTPHEMEQIICGTEAEKEQTLFRLFSEGRVRLDGDSYIPGISLHEYNLAHGTQFDRYDVDLDLGLLDGKTVQMPQLEIRKNAVKQKGRGMQDE